MIKILIISLIIRLLTEAIRGRKEQSIDTEIELAYGSPELVIHPAEFLLRWE